MAEILELRHVSMNYRDHGKTLQAVRDVSFSVREGETFGIVGESGCGKSTLARLIMCLEKPAAGEIWFKGQRLDTMRERERRRLRPRFQMVFQDSGSSLNPRRQVRDILADPMLYHGLCTKREVEKRAGELLEMVGLSAEMQNRYPHAFSGGQRQRICIARALSLKPDLVILDEPVSALDVSVQAQILNLLRDLQERLHLTCIFIAHGLGAVHYMSQQVAVMYLGSVVETGDADVLFAHPAHPYTRGLLDAAPLADADARNRARQVIRGEMDQEPPSGACPLYFRCPRADKSCLHFGQREMQKLDGDHAALCTRAWEG